MSLLKIMTQQTEGKSAPIHVDEFAPAVSFKGDAHDKDEAKKAAAIYAATNLEFWESDKSHYFAHEISIIGTCFRRLDPDYYAWFRHKMITAQASHQA